MNTSRRQAHDYEVSRHEHRAIVTAERDARAVRSIGTQFFVNGAVVASYIPRLPEIREHLDASLTSIGSALAFASIGGILGGALVGVRPSRSARRR